MNVHTHGMSSKQITLDGFVGNHEIRNSSMNKFQLILESKHVAKFQKEGMNNHSTSLSKNITNKTILPVHLECLSHKFPLLEDGGINPILIKLKHEEYVEVEATLLR